MRRITLATQMVIHDQQRTAALLAQSNDLCFPLAVVCNGWEKSFRSQGADFHPRQARNVR